MAFRKGIQQTEFPQTTLALLAKVVPHNNVLVGDDPVQIRFMEQQTGVLVAKKTLVHDEQLLGSDQRLLLQVATSNAIELSPSIKAKTGVWSLAPLDKGTPGATAIVKFASQLAQVKTDKEQTQLVANLIVKEGIFDVRAAVWRAVGVYLDGPLPPFKPWPEPWVQPLDWLPSGVEVSFRLNALYRELVGYVFIRGEDKAAATKFGLPPSKAQYLKNLTLDPARVYDSISSLSRWRGRRSDDVVEAMRIARIWTK